MLSGRRLSYLKKKEKLAEPVTHCHSLSLVVPLIVIPCHLFSLFVICCHSLSFVVARCTTRCHSLSLDIIRCHSLYHSLSLDVLLVCLYKRSFSNMRIEKSYDAISDCFGYDFWSNKTHEWVTAWCKSGTGTLGPATRDPPQSLKVGPGTSLKFKSGTPEPPSKFRSRIPRPPSKFKSGTPSPFFNEFIFFRIFNRFLSLCLFQIWHIQKKYQLRVTEINSQH